VPKAIFVVHTEPSSPDKDAEYNDWYANTHVPDVIALPGFVGATRYKLSEAQLGKAPEGLPPYVTVYELEADDLQATLAGLGAGIASGAVRMENAPLGPGMQTAVYEEVTPRQTP
jgi:hypothetical protein